MINYHTPVLLTEVLQQLRIQKDEKYIDATLGGGGHTEAILSQGGIVLGIDQDQTALEYVQKSYKLQIISAKLKAVQGNFRNLETIARLHNFTNVSGILFDLGVSSHQLDTGERGFSFQTNAKLDMRMDSSLTVTASDLVNALTKNELQLLFTKYGEEPRARQFAERIVTQRKIKPITTTQELANILVAGSHHTKIHPATRVFQALRIAVNDELQSLEKALPQAVNLLKKQGRVCVISFHSLEDRIVKQAFVEIANKNYGSVITKKPIVSTELEINQNRRSRSAKLRVFEKI